MADDALVLMKMFTARYETEGNPPTWSVMCGFPGGKSAEVKGGFSTKEEAEAFQVKTIQDLGSNHKGQEIVVNAVCHTLSMVKALK